MSESTEFESCLLDAEETIRDQDGWSNFDAVKMSENELINSTGVSYLENDNQTKLFCKFLALATNFSSMDFNEKLSIVPELVASIESLINEMKNEVKQYADIAVEFQNIINCFVHLVIQTKHKLNMIRQPLSSSIEHLEIISEVLESNENLNEDDQHDISYGFNGLKSGVQKYLDFAKTAVQESKDIDNRITTLRENVTRKRVMADGRLSFSQSLSIASPFIGIGTGGSAGALAVNSPELLLLSGLSFGPIGFIVMGAALGGITIGGIAFLLHKLWSRHQHKAIEYLNQILHGLNRLQSANLSFLIYMNKSEESSFKVLESIEFIETSLLRQSIRYRKRSSKICKKSIESTKSMIDCIDRISKIDIQTWTNEIQNYVFNYSNKCIKNER